MNIIQFINKNDEIYRKTQSNDFYASMFQIDQYNASRFHLRS